MEFFKLFIIIYVSIFLTNKYYVFCFNLGSSEFDFPTNVTMGTCWYNVDLNSRQCSGFYMDGVTLEDCCSVGNQVGGWTPTLLNEDYDFFQFVILGRDIEDCSPCKLTCNDIQCPTGQSCRMLNNKPTCVCELNCESNNEEVCGADGHTYASECSLLRFNCRRRQNNYVDYKGPCQDSCATVTCDEGKNCILDQNIQPHCVRCISCDHYDNNPVNNHDLDLNHHDNNPINNHDLDLNHHDNYPVNNNDFDLNHYNQVCGSDGITYKSSCLLERNACLKGLDVFEAYTGPCLKNASCLNIQCEYGLSCLMDETSERPICVDCSNTDSCTSVSELCASNHQTYPSYCHMMKYACTSHTYLYTLHSGFCSDERISI